jgi:hypothetical protein
LVPAKLARVMRAAIAILLVVILMAAALVAALLWFPAPLLRAGLRAAGIETVAFDELRLGTSSLELSGLKVGAPADHRVARLQIRYRLGDLLRGRIQSVEIEGLELRGRIVDGRIELAGLETQGEPGEPAAIDVLPWPAKVVVRAAEVQLASPWGELRLPLMAELQPTAAEAKFRIEVTDGRLINDAGRLRTDVRLKGAVPLDRAITPADVTATGKATIAVEGFAVPQVAEGVDGQSEVTFELNAGKLDARLGPALLEVGSLAPSLVALGEPLPPPWQLRVGDETAPLRVTAELSGETAALQVAGALDLAAGQVRLGGDVAASLDIEDGSRFGQFAGQARLRLAQLHWREVALERGQLELAAQGTPMQWQGTVDLELAGGGQPIPGLTLDGVTLRHHLAAALADRRLTVASRETGALTAQRATWRGAASTGPLALQLEPAEEPLFDVMFEAGGGISRSERRRRSAHAPKSAISPSPLAATRTACTPDA